jgi:hypothetical protein
MPNKEIGRREVKIDSPQHFAEAGLEESVIIRASVKKVWEMFIDLSCWRKWNTVLTVASSDLNGAIAKGRSFSCLIRPFAFAIYLEPLAEEVLPYAKVLLTGRRFGITARHEFLFSGNAEKTVVTSRETFRGILPALPGWFFLEHRIRELTRCMLRDLKVAAEKK